MKHRIAVIVAILAVAATFPGAAPAAADAPPVTTHTLNPATPDGQGGVYRGPVEISLSATDDTGVAKTEYRVDGGEWQTYQPETVIYDGTEASLAKWRQAPSGKFYRLPDGTLQPTGGLGMLWYPEEYGDAAIKLQFRDMNPAPVTGSNSGVFIRFPNPDEVTALPAEERHACQTGSGATSPAWSAIYCGHEIQLYDGSTGEGQKTGSVYNFKPLNLDQAKITTRGTWNDYEIRVTGDGDYTAEIIRNGQTINTFVNTPDQVSSRGGDPGTDARQFARGYFGIQNHGPAVDLMQFRNIRVQDLSPISVTKSGTHTVEYRSTDSAGNVETPKSVTFTIDPTAPPA